MLSQNDGPYNLLDDPLAFGYIIAVSRCIACAAALTPPLPPLRKGGKVGGVWSFFPPLRRGDTGGFFECPRVVPGSVSTRLKTALLICLVICLGVTQLVVSRPPQESRCVGWAI